MVIKREVAYGIVQALSDFWNATVLTDLTVTLGTAQFACHRFLLAACSGYFRELFRSEIQEFKCVYLENISCNIFELILETLYTGRSVMTDDNVIDIWRAAHYLKIHFLLKECEDFVIKTLSLQNYVAYYFSARELNSDTVANLIWKFILKNANSFLKTTYFQELPLGDVMKLVKSQDLVTDSEDDVLNAIIKWVEFTPIRKVHSTPIDLEKTLKVTKGLNENMDKSKTLNGTMQLITSLDNRMKDECIQIEITDGKGDENHKDIIPEENTITRDMPNVTLGHDVTQCDTNSEVTRTTDESRKQNLPLLLSNARVCIASQKCLEMFLRHPLVSENQIARDTVVSALLYQLQIDKRNGQWPSGAIYRNISAYENVAVSRSKCGEEMTIKAFSFSKQKWFRLTSLNFKGKVILADINKTLYALGNSFNNSQSTSQPNNGFNFNAPHVLTGFSFGNTTAQTFRAQKEEKKVNVNKVAVSLFKLTNGVWSDTFVYLSLSAEDISAVVVDEYLYVFSPTGQEVWKVEPFSKNQCRVTDMPHNQPVCHLMCYNDLILVFSSSTDDGLVETVVQCYDTSKNDWTKLNNLEGPATEMASFKDDHSTYLLQSTGDLWKLVMPQSNVVDFEHVVKLWSGDWSLHGAVTFLDNLYIYRVQSETRENDPQLRTSLPGVFSQIIYMESEESESLFLPFVVNRCELKNRT